MLSKGHKNEYVTTMFDYYAMPKDTPGIECQDTDLIQRMRTIESEIDKDLGLPNCKFQPSAFSIIADQGVVNEIQKIRESFPTPEHINNSYETAPSKRLEALIPNYAKVKNGTLLAKNIGIDTLMRECPHFKNWISSIAQLA